MRKLFVIVGLSVTAVFIVLLIWSWRSGQLFFRQPNVTVEYNGTASPESRLYKSGNGDLMLTLEQPNARFPIYMIVTDAATESKYVGILASENPSKNRLQFSMSAFAACVSCETFLGFPDNFNGTAKMVELPNGFDFSIYNDNVKVRY